MKPPPLVTGLIVIQVAFITAAGAAEERDEKIKQLERRLESFEQKYQLLEKRLAELERPSEKPSSAQALSIGASGFSMRSADTNFVLKLRGVVNVDSRNYVDDGGVEDNDTFILRRARPIIEGTLFRDFSFRLMPEFGGSSTTIRDAWLGYRYRPELQVRIGKMKTPFGLERLQSSTDLLLVERSLASDLTPNRDLGLMLFGELWDGLLEYQTGIFNGVGDDSNSNNRDFDDQKTGVARLILRPFHRVKDSFLNGLSLGIAGTYGDQDGEAGLPAGGGYVTEGQQDFFLYSGGVEADGRHWRLSPQAYYSLGPFGLMAEYIISSQRLRQTAAPVESASVNHKAWQVTGSYVLTGEEASYRGVTPKNNFDPRRGSWGAFEMAARYSHLDIDDAVFPTFADPSTSASRAASWGLAINWYLNQNLKASTSFIQTDFKGGSSGAITRRDERVFLTRFQVAF